MFNFYGALCLTKGSNLVHETSSVGRIGKEKTLFFSSGFWTGIHKDVQEFYASCLNS